MSQSQEIKKRQSIIFGILVAVVFSLCFGFYFFMESDSEKVVLVEKRFDLPGDKVDAQSIWMGRFEDQNKGLEARLKYVEELMLASKKNEEQTIKENANLREELAKVKKEAKSLAEKAVISEKETFLEKIQKEPMLQPLIPQGFVVEQKRVPLREVVANSKEKRVKHVDTTIPSGTTVKAILVSSVDAPCGVLSVNDPYPVKLRILDDGHLPKGVEAKLKGGLVIAAVYGDISSERVYMRLERLTQVIESGNFIETEIAGFVSGEDGKYGVRGSVVDKSSRLVGNAALSGVFSGISDYFKAVAGANCYDRCCDEDYTRFGCDILQGGACNGTSTAFDTLTDYYIKRADQIRPVIQVNAGRIVDITFTHGSEIGDLYTKEKVKKIRERGRT